LSLNNVAPDFKVLFKNTEHMAIVDKSKRFGICTAFSTSTSISTPTLTSVCKAIGKKAASKRDRAENNDADVPKKEGEFVVQSAYIALEINGIILVKPFALIAKAFLLNKIAVYGLTKVAHPFKLMVVNALLLEVTCKKRLGIL
ncbi:hypothetical protein GGTG_10375, partial [Gaeumannomyces tritici R3-111a-1]